MHVIPGVLPSMSETNKGDTRDQAEGWKRDDKQERQQSRPLGRERQSGGPFVKLLDEIVMHYISPCQKRERITVN